MQMLPGLRQRRRRRSAAEDSVNGMDSKRAASSPIVIGGGKAIVGRQLTMASRRMLVGGRVIFTSKIVRVLI
jgi:hypothetical protein